MKKLIFMKSIVILVSLMIVISCKSGNAPKVPELETESVTDITASTAKSGGKIISDGSAEITVKGVCWGDQMDPITSGLFSEEGSGGEAFTSTLTGLEPDKEYHVRAFATNIAGTAYGDDKTFRTLSGSSPAQIIADHTIIDRFDDIPQYYIDIVKKMWLVIPGESHSQAYRTGLALLESSNPLYAVSIVKSGTPEGYTTSNLRSSRATWGDVSNASGWIYNYGEEDWWTSPTAISRTKAGITYCNSHNLKIDVIGFGWCYDPEITEATDYLTTTQEYITFCSTNGYSTKVIFTTGPVDNAGGLAPEADLYNLIIRNYGIRDYVKLSPDRILFDYADILCYDDGSEVLNTRTWNGHTFPYITPTNLGDASIGHIGSTGAIRLAKAMWWMLARIAGWDGN